MKNIVKYCHCFRSAVILLIAFSHHTLADDSDSLITSFNDVETGVAFTMLSQNSWNTPSNQNFHQTPTDGQNKLQAVTITNQSKKIMPYQGDSQYGLIFNMAQSYEFYQYFATKSVFTDQNDQPISCDKGKATMVSPISEPPASSNSSTMNWAVACKKNAPGQQITLCARCADGGACAGSANKPSPPAKLWPALGDQVPYSEFNKAKNAIVKASGSTQTCSWTSGENIWNEFDLNGLSPKALAGVMIDGTYKAPPDKWKPKDSLMCKYLQSVDAKRTSWPVYTLTFIDDNKKPSSLTKTRTLTCSSDS